MAEGESSAFDSLDTRREYTRIALLVASIAAVVLVASLLPFALSTGAGAGDGAPLAGVLPGPEENAVPKVPASNGTKESNESNEGGSSGGGLGALNPSESTAVGGSIETNPYRNNETAVHFVVTSSVASYWRTGAYSTYTGSGWARSDGLRASEEPITNGPTTGQTAEYRVELKQPATAMPTVWRPTSIDVAADLQVTPEAGVRPESPLESGTTYEGRSQIPPRDPSVLRATGRSYPEPIEDGYTGLPEETVERVSPFTDNLTANTSSPYETAVRIETWLETSKSYSLKVAEPPADDVASQFIFEMEEGYCEYFATAMTVMLRSQDIPARYVVGYSTGQPIDDSTYLVRSMNAHAWVEVYFPEVGWVRFDPTPGSARLQNEQRVMNETPMGGEAYNHTEEGSPGENCSCAGGQPGGDEPVSTTNATQNRTPDRPNESDPGTHPSEKQPTLDFELNRTPVPGVPVMVTVTRGNQTVAGVSVRFNGDTVGTTNESGVVVARVPYVRELTVTVEASSDAHSSLSTGGLPTLRGDPPPTHTLVYGIRVADRADQQVGDRTGSRSPTGPHGTVFQQEPVRNETNRSYTLPDRATVTLEGQVVPNGTAVVAATIEDVPIRQATVYLEDTRIGQTSDAGTLLVNLPTEPGNYTVRVERGPVRGNTSFELDALSLALRPKWPLALPGTSIIVNASRGGDPAAGVPISVAGQQVGGTDDSGRLEATLPLRDTVTVVGQQYGQVRRVQVTGLYRNTAMLLGGIAFVSILGFGLAYWRGYRPRTVLRSIRIPFDLLLSWSVGALVSLSGLLAALPTAVRARLARIVARLRDVWAGRVTVQELIEELRTWVLATLAAVGRMRQHRVDEVLEENMRTAGASPTASMSEEPSVRDAWQRFLDTVSIRHPERRTPGDIARHAVDVDSLPSEPVVTLLEVFREVEYGDRSPADRLDRVRGAIRDIERAAMEGDEDG